jgi:hypothetical protein
VDNPADFYRRIPKKDRKKTILEELYDDTKVKKYVYGRILRRMSYPSLFRFSKKRYGEIKERNRRLFAASKHMKRLKNKKR